MKRTARPKRVLIRRSDGLVYVRPTYEDLLAPYLVAEEIVPSDHIGHNVVAERQLVRFFEVNEETLIAPAGMHDRILDVLKLYGIVIYSDEDEDTERCSFVDPKVLNSLHPMARSSAISMVLKRRATVIVRNDKDRMDRLLLIDQVCPDAKVHFWTRTNDDADVLQRRLQNLGVNTDPRGGMCEGPNLVRFPAYDSPIRVFVYPDADLAMTLGHFETHQWDASDAHFIAIANMSSYLRYSEIGRMLIEANFGPIALELPPSGRDLEVAILEDSTRRLSRNWRHLRSSDKRRDIWRNTERNRMIARAALDLDALSGQIAAPGVHHYQRDVAILVEVPEHRDMLAQSVTEVAQDIHARDTARELRDRIRIITTMDSAQDGPRASILLLADGGHVDTDSIIGNSLVSNCGETTGYPFLIVDFQAAGQQNRFESYRQLGVRIHLKGSLMSRYTPYHDWRSVASRSWFPKACTKPIEILRKKRLTPPRTD